MRLSPPDWEESWLPVCVFWETLQGPSLPRCERIPIASRGKGRLPPNHLDQQIDAGRTGRSLALPNVFTVMLRDWVRIQTSTGEK
jgi:hypothetical protein